MRCPPMFRQREVKGKSDFQLLIGKFVSLLVDPGRSSLPVVSAGRLSGSFCDRPASGRTHRKPALATIRCAMPGSITLRDRLLYRRASSAGLRRLFSDQSVVARPSRSCQKSRAARCSVWTSSACSASLISKLAARWSTQSQKNWTAVRLIRGSPGNST